MMVWLSFVKQQCQGVQRKKVLKEVEGGFLQDRRRRRIVFRRQFWPLYNCQSIAKRVCCIQCCRIRERNEGNHVQEEVGKKERSLQVRLSSLGRCYNYRTAPYCQYRQPIVVSPFFLHFPIPGTYTLSWDTSIHYPYIFSIKRTFASVHSIQQQYTSCS